MSFKGKRWVWLEQDKEDVKRLAENLEIAPALARVILNRGVTGVSQGAEFLAPSLKQLHSPWLMKGMREAVQRLSKAINDGEKIVVHGDYDADGISATAIMVEMLQSLGAEVGLYLPSRFADGYGLHPEPLKDFRNDGASLVVTVDCGINAVEEINLASSIGLDIIVTDHHQPLEEVTQAAAIINPLQESCSYPFKELSGAGVAFKLAAALSEEHGRPFPCQLLDLAALGTAADVVPLAGENRVIIAEGLKILKTLDRPGLKALIKAAGLDQDKINSTTLSFILAPHINAAGRMGDALPAARLLLAKELSQAAPYATELCKANKARKETENRILREAEQEARQQLKSENPKVVVLSGTNWHQGVIGIVASRLVDLFNRPVALVAMDGDEGTGSARSVSGFNITGALEYSSRHLERFGGHDQAAGFTVKADNFNLLRDSLNQYAGSNLDDTKLQPVLTIDAELDYADMTHELAYSLENLEPLGTGNPRPVFVSPNWELNSWRAVGKDKSHVKMDLKKSGDKIQPIFFSASDFIPHFEKGRLIDIAFTIQNGSFRGDITLDHIIKDVRYSDCCSSENLEIIDWRDRDKKGLPIVELLRETGERAIILTATSKAGAKLDPLKDKERGPVIITNGAAGKLPQMLSNRTVLILYDLPMHEGVFRGIVGNAREIGLEKIYLAYGKKDLDFNQHLLDLSLPSAEMLKLICSSLINDAKTGLNQEFPGSASESLPFKPVSKYWKRALDILDETGFLDQGVISPHYVDVLASWPRPLEKSPSYLETLKLRNSCLTFQDFFLSNSPREIASYFQGCREPGAGQL